MTFLTAGIHILYSEGSHLKQSEHVDRQLAQAEQHSRLFGAKSFPKYLWYSLRESAVYQRARSFWVNFRRYRLISRVITVLATLLTFMSTGAVAVLFAVICLLLVPILLLGFGGTMLLGLFFRAGQNRFFMRETEGKTVYLLFPSHLENGTFTAALCRELSERPNSAVFIISPYAWSAKGVGGKGFYLNARQESHHLFLLRRHYFFFFRRLLTQRETKRTVVIL